MLVLEASHGPKKYYYVDYAALQKNGWNSLKYTFVVQILLVAYSNIAGEEIKLIQINLCKTDSHVPEAGDKTGMSCSVCQIVFESVEIQVTNVVQLNYSLMAQSGHLEIIQ